MHWGPRPPWEAQDCVCLCFWQYLLGDLWCLVIALVNVQALLLCLAANYSWLLVSPDQHRVISSLALQTAVTDSSAHWLLCCPWGQMPTQSAGSRLCDCADVATRIRLDPEVPCPWTSPLLPSRMGTVTSPHWAPDDKSKAVPTVSSVDPR